MIEHSYIVYTGHYQDESNLKIIKGFKALVLSHMEMSFEFESVKVKRTNLNVKYLKSLLFDSPAIKYFIWIIMEQ